MFYFFSFVLLRIVLSLSSASSSWIEIALEKTTGEQKRCIYYGWFQ